MTKHLKGLDTLRALAAMIVVWSHLEILKPLHHQDPALSFFPNAHFSVTLFLVLSGFLITFLLIQEKEKTGRILFKKFYLRRVFRIWPVYYFVLFLSYFLVSKEVSPRTIFLCLTIFPNVPMALKSSWQGSPQIWSIGVEEQFYIFWPLFISLLPKRLLKTAIIAFILSYTLLPHIINLLNSIFIHNEKLFSFTQIFFAYTKFNCMAIGGLVGVLFAERSNILRLFYGNFMLSIFYFVFPIAVWIFNIKFGIFTDEIYALFFSMLVISVVANPFFNIDNPVTSFLGKISYGIYMYHWIIIVLLFSFLDRMHFNNPLLVYLLSFGITIFIAYLSFNTFEKYFLTVKKKFEV